MTKDDGRGTITHYIYDGDQIIAEYDDSGALTAKYVYGAGIDEPVRMEKGGTSYYYHFDGLGSVIALSDTSGNLIESYSYDVYGKPNTSSTLGNHFLFTGREYDPETELYYYRERYYDLSIGRFLQRDPLEIEDENDYTYCNNNPINWIDPYGLFLAPAVPIGYGPPLPFEHPFPGDQTIGKKLDESNDPTSFRRKSEEKAKGDEKKKPKDKKPDRDIREDKNHEHFDKKTKKDEPEHWHYGDYNWNPKTGRWEPGKWRYGGAGSTPNS